MKSTDYSSFQQNYSANILKKLDEKDLEFHTNFYDVKQPYFLAVFGVFVFCQGIYFFYRDFFIFGTFAIIIGLVFFYIPFKQRKIVFRVSNSGIWSSEFGLIYFRHIERFEFYRYVGKMSSERMKIYMNNYKLYSMRKPFLEEAISQVENYGELKVLLVQKLEGSQLDRKTKHSSL